jgi:DNA-binding NarL/FixJ family response regulator
MIRVLVVDDHAIVRAGIKQILAQAPGFAQCDEAGDGAAALEKVRNHKYDVAVLDITLPGVSGIDLIKRIRHDRPDCKVLILSMHKEDQFAVRALRAGAAGYLTKESAPDLLVSAIRKVAQGGRYVSPELGEKLAAEVDDLRERAPHELLSDREHQIFRMLVAGDSVNAIAAALNVSAKTVSTHKQRLMKKLHVDNNAALVHYALSHKLFA